MGAMQPPSSVGFARNGLTFPSPVFLGEAIECDGEGYRALTRFGVGAIETTNDSEAEFPSAVARCTRVDSVAAGMADSSTLISTTQLDVVVALSEQRRVLFVTNDLELALFALSQIAFGVVLHSKNAVGATNHVRVLRAHFAQALLIVGGSWVEDPDTALSILAAGSDMVLVDQGLSAAGPGLPKRINQVVASERSVPPVPGYDRRWAAGALVGLALAGGGTAMLLLAMTTVTLPYNDRFVGLSGSAYDAINPRLRAFMAHDRMTFGGTMLSLGSLYFGLTAFGLRMGRLWAHRAYLISASIGFASLFLFLIFGYFDPLHALFSASLFPLFIHSVARSPAPQHSGRDRVNDRVWRRGLVGQMLFVVLACGLLLSGLAISAIGSTQVFVLSDLAFLEDTRDHLAAGNPHLLPLIAHDRAGFGGGLVADGVAVLLISLWGFGRGEKWVWWTLAVGGSSGFVFAVLAHVQAGYLEFGHVFPVAVAGALFIGALALSWPFLCEREPQPSRG